jgi:RNA polymerase sigma-70 factor (ECF subfamily)
VTKTKGRFRSFLLACLDHYLSNEYDRRRAKKRSAKLVSLDFDVAENLYNQTKHETPERLFNRQWAVGVIEKALAALRREIGPRFDVLKEYITAGRPGSVREIAERLELTESNVKVIVHRARKRYRDLLKEEIARTVEKPQEVDDELKELFAALS